MDKVTHYVGKVRTEGQQVAVFIDFLAGMVKQGVDK